MILDKKFGSFSSSLFKSWHTVSREFRWSFVSRRGTNFAATRLMPRSWVTMRWTELQLTPVTYGVTTVFVEFFTDFCDIFVVAAAWRASRMGLILEAQIPLFKVRKPFTRARLRACSLKASWSISNDSVGVFPRRKQNFKQVLCSLKSDITISTGSQKLPSWKLTVRSIELIQEDVRLASDSWGSREEALTLSSHSSAFGGLETGLVSIGYPPRIRHAETIAPEHMKLIWHYT